MLRTLAAALFALTASMAFAAPSTIDIARVKAPIAIDGEIAEAEWRDARRVDSFVEYFRADNAPAQAPTAAWIGYDDEFLYVAFRNGDPRPDDIRAPLVDRDKVLGDQDYVAVLLDTKNDRRSGVAFRVNPRGVQTDSIVTDMTDEDFSPDFFYDAVARRTNEGWTAELRIPLSSLRYPASDPQTWGVILMRNYPRDFRYIMSNTPIPKNSGCFLCHAATLSGLSGLPAGSHMRLTPYSTANVSENSALPAAGAGARLAEPSRRFDSDLGLDLKWSPSTRLTIDGTLNPDFSQIESDVPQSTVNTRFALEYPEKRTFFLESTDLLSTPIRAVYTRTITSPSWGLRATGESGTNAYTLLVAEDRGGGSLILPSESGSDFVPQDFRSQVLIGRLRRTFGNSFGALLLSARELEGGGHNRLLGPDFLWKLSSGDRLSGQALVSSTKNPDRPELHTSFDGRADDGFASRIVYERDTKRYDIWSAVSQYSPGFRADNGFVVQNNLRRGGLWVGLRSYPTKFLSYVRVYSGIEHDVAYEGGQSLRSGLYQGVYVQGKWGLDGWATAMVTKERVGGKLLDSNALEFDVRTVPTRWLPQVRLDGIAGQRIDYAGARVGTGARINLSTTFRPTDHLEVQLRNTREWLDLSGDRLFTANIDWLKLTYNFTSRSLTRLIVQQSQLDRNAALYASPVKEHDKTLSLSGLYGYKLNWQTVFFVGYGDSSITADHGGLTREGRSVFMKVAYAFQR